MWVHVMKYIIFLFYLFCSACLTGINRSINWKGIVFYWLVGARTVADIGESGHCTSGRAWVSIANVNCPGISAEERRTARCTREVDRALSQPALYIQWRLSLPWRWLRISGEKVSQTKSMRTKAITFIPSLKLLCRFISSHQWFSITSVIEWHSLALRSAAHPWWSPLIKYARYQYWIIHYKSRVHIHVRHSPEIGFRWPAARADTRTERRRRQHKR